MSEYFGRFAIITCPEAKIFQTHLQDGLLEDPSRIFTNEDVPIYVERASGRLEFRLGKPRVFMRAQSTDRSEDLNFLVEWLTGGDDGMMCQETEQYGIVKLRYDAQVERAIMEGVMGSLNGGNSVISKEIASARDAELESAKRRSRERVMRAIRRCYENMKKQLEYNKEAGGGHIQPSKVELLCNYVLKQEIAAERARQSRIQQEIEDTLGADPFAVDNVMAGAASDAAPAPKQRRARKPKDVVQSEEVRSDEPV